MIIQKKIAVLYENNDELITEIYINNQFDTNIVCHSMFETIREHNIMSYSIKSSDIDFYVEDETTNYPLFLGKKQCSTINVDEVVIKDKNDFQKIETKTEINGNTVYKTYVIKNRTL